MVKRWRPAKEPLRLGASCFCRKTPPSSPVYEKERGTQAVMRKSCERQEKTHPRSLDRCVFQISLLFFQMMAATFGDRHAFFAERAFFRLVGRNGEVEQRIYLFLRYAEVCFAAASVY